MSVKPAQVFKRVLQACAAFAAFFAVYYSYVHYIESRAIASYISSNDLTPDELSRSNILQVVDRVRTDFNSDENTFKQLNMDARPFLREDTQTLLNYKEGLCGEGTRVLVNLLRTLGYDATRITLYDKRLQSAHTLVSVRLNGQEFLVDSINSMDWVHILLDSALIAPSEFDVLHYTDNHEVRAKFEVTPRERRSAPLIDRFFRIYRIYSYEALPFTKLLTTLGWDVRIFNFQRPGRLASYLAEAPNIIYMFALAGVSITCLVLSLLPRMNIRPKV